MQDKIIEASKKMLIEKYSTFICIDLRQCNNPAFCQIVLFCMSKIQSREEDAQDAEVVLSDSDRRKYRVSKDCDAESIRKSVLDCRIMQGFR